MAIGARTDWRPVSGRRLLIGLGNELRGDDAAGLLVAREARRRLAGGARVLPAGAGLADGGGGGGALALDAKDEAAGRGAGVEVLELGGEPVELLEAWDGAHRVVLADAVSSGAAAGIVHRLDAAAPLPASLAGASTHLLGLAEAIELARALGRLPPRLLVLGIEGESFATGAAPTPAVTAAIPTAAIQALKALTASVNT